uniref:transcription factor A, mitochondrial n=1 Tax=Doryrhamphus excisus TaxID=161450 RepID=UPI0025AE3662|nr:transcription factor A, mitochondrial [Doryrhamphus excisus]
MAPLSFVTASVSLLAKSFSVFTCTSTLARVVQAAYSNPVKCLCTQAGGPPKRPLNGYMRYVMQQKPLMARQNPELKQVVMVSKIAQAWRAMTPEQKQPFEDAFQREQEQFKIDLEHYQAQLTPAEVQQQVTEKRQRRAKRKAIRKKRELTNMGKPKRPRSPFNIFMSEHYEEAKGTTTQAKMKSLFDDWRDLISTQKQVYIQLAEDDKIRYKNEMKSWEDHMVDIGREDLIRDLTLSAKKKAAKTSKTVKKVEAKRPATAEGASTATTMKAPGSASKRKTKKT